MFKSLYIHIPFCKMICTYCDFKREINTSANIKIYIKKIMHEIDSITHPLETIYLGGGTPNILDDVLLDEFLNSLQKNLLPETEFTIELNPEFITQSQIDVLKENNINRISLGIQSTDNQILKDIKRLHTIEMAENALILLKQNGFENISCDFICNLPNMQLHHVDEMIAFLKRNDVHHLSFYSLEVKEGSYLNKIHYQIDEVLDEQLLFHFIEQTNLKRYEISNWASDPIYESKHNKTYWNLQPWKGIGYGSVGFENNSYIETIGNSAVWIYKAKPLSKIELLKDRLIMGLRQARGICLNDKKNLNAYNAFKDLIPANLITIKDDYLFANDINLLNEILIKII
ncbi:MAG: radical SAM protein [Mycoplasmoidaceae bacterium]